MAHVFHPPWFQQLNEYGERVPYGRLRFFREPGSSDLTTYQDGDLQSPHPVTIVADASGVFPPVYLPDGYYQYRVQYYDQSGKVLRDVRKVNAPLGDEQPTTSTSTVEEYTADFSVGSTTLNKVLAVAATGSVITVEMPPPDDYDNEEAIIAHTGSGSFVVINVSTGENVGGYSAIYLRPGGVVNLKSDGSEWLKVGEVLGRLPPVIIAKSKSSSSIPGSPVAGDLYVAKSSSPPSPWSADQIYIWDGDNDWQEYAPYEGQSVIVIDELVNSRPKEYVFISSAWQLKSVVQASAAFAIEQTSGTAATATSATTWNALSFNTTRYNGISGLSLTGGQFLFANTGYYTYRLTVSCFETGHTRAAVSDAADSATRQVGTNVDAPTNASIGSDAVMTATAVGVINIDTASETWKAELYTELVGAVGKAQTIGSAEIYATIEFTEMSIVSG